MYHLTIIKNNEAVFERSFLTWAGLKQYIQYYFNIISPPIEKKALIKHGAITLSIRRS